MTVIKLTKSGKAVQIVDDDGRIYQTSVNSMMYLLSGKAKGGFITTVRLPFSVAANRFAPSKLYDPNGVFKGDAGKTLTTTNDSLSVKTREAVQVKKVYEDKKVW